MITRYTCALNGAELHDIDPAIHITDIIEMAPLQRIVTAALPGHGTQLLRHVRESLTIRISLLIQAYAPTARRDILQRICAWAADGGILTTGDRPGQQLHVTCTGLPSCGAMAWLDELTLSFTAYALPFWEKADAVSVTTSSSAAFECPGNAGVCPVDCTVTNQGDAALTTLTLMADHTTITLEGLSLAPGSSLTLAAEENRLRIYSGNTSLLSHRTPLSDDLLLAPCGSLCTLSVSSLQPVEATFTARGRFL